jgi:hypothetical protein
MKDGSLITEEEKCLLLSDMKLRNHHRATDRPAELVAFDVVAARRLPVPSVEDIVPHKLQDAAVKMVGPGFRDYIDHGPRVLSILSTKLLVCTLNSRPPHDAKRGRTPAMGRTSWGPDIASASPAHSPAPRCSHRG